MALRLGVVQRAHVRGHRACSGAVKGRTCAGSGASGPPGADLTRSLPGAWRSSSSSAGWAGASAARGDLLERRLGVPPAAAQWILALASAAAFLCGRATGILLTHARRCSSVGSSALCRCRWPA